MALELLEERSRVGAARVLPLEHDTVSRANADGAEEHALRVGARDRDDARGADRRPRRAQRRKEALERSIGDQHHVGGLDRRSQATAESPFFCAR